MSIKEFLERRPQLKEAVFISIIVSGLLLTLEMGREIIFSFFEPNVTTIEILVKIAVYAVEGICLMGLLIWMAPDLYEEYAGN